MGHLLADVRPMNEPAPFAPAPEAPQHAPMAPPAPPAPPAPAGFAQPTDPAAALDVTAPLMMQPPVAPHAAPAMPAAPAFAGQQQPEQPAAPRFEQIVPSAPSFQQLASAPAEQQHHVEHPQSPAMPAHADHVVHHAMPAGYDEPPAPVGGVATATPQDLAERAALAPVPVDGAAPAASTPEWASPGWALVLAMFALTWQLVSYYAREILPSVKASGTLLSNFDEIVGNAPLVGSSLGGIVGMVLGFGGLILMLLGVRAGLREPVLQGVIGFLSIVALAATVLLPKLAG